MPATMPPPPSANRPSEFGAPPPTDSILPAPAQPPGPGATQAVGLVHAMVGAARQLAELFPATVPLVTQINDLIQQVQLKVVQSMPPTETAAPPV